MFPGYLLCLFLSNTRTEANTPETKRDVYREGEETGEMGGFTYLGMRDMGIAQAFEGRSHKARYKMLCLKQQLAVKRVYL